MQRAQAITQLVQSIATTLGIGVAGLWALRQYRRQREYLWNVNIDCEQELLPYVNTKRLLVIRIGLKNIGKQVFVPGPKGLELAIKRIPLTLHPGELLRWDNAEPFLQTTDILEQYLDSEALASGEKDYKRDDRYCLDVGGTYRETAAVVVEPGFVYLIELTLWDRAAKGDSMCEYHVVTCI